MKILDGKKSSIRNIYCNKINIFMPKNKKCQVVVLDGKIAMLKHSNRDVPTTSDEHHYLDDKPSSNNSTWMERSNEPAC